MRLQGIVKKIKKQCDSRMKMSVEYPVVEDRREGCYVAVQRKVGRCRDKKQHIVVGIRGEKVTLMYQVCE